MKNISRDCDKIWIVTLASEGQSPFSRRERTLEARPEALRLRQWFCNMVSAWQIARKEKEGDGERRHIPGAEFKIHVNIIRLAVHFLAANASRFIVRSTSEATRIDASISSVVDRRRHELYSSTDRWRLEREGNRNLASHISARGFRSYPLLPPIVNHLPAYCTTCASRRTSALWKNVVNPRIT